MLWCEFPVWLTVITDENGQNRSHILGSLQDMISMGSHEQIEMAVSAGTGMLEVIKQRLQNTQTMADKDQWLQRTDNLLQKAQPERAVVGVYGVTGAGKSSMINALLDEHALVPTSCTG
jgi:ribosome biogenesis GTPase A